MLSARSTRRDGLVCRSESPLHQEVEDERNELEAHEVHPPVVDVADEAIAGSEHDGGEDGAERGGVEAAAEPIHPLESEDDEQDDREPSTVRDAEDEAEQEVGAEERIFGNAMPTVPPHQMGSMQGAGGTAGRSRGRTLPRSKIDGRPSTP